MSSSGSSSGPTAAAAMASRTTSAASIRRSASAVCSVTGQGAVAGPCWRGFGVPFSGFSCQVSADSPHSASDSATARW